MTPAVAARPCYKPAVISAAAGGWAAVVKHCSLDRQELLHVCSLWAQRSGIRFLAPPRRQVDHFWPSSVIV